MIAGGIALRRKAEGMDPLLAEQVGQRAGILSILAFVVFGLLALLWVNEKKGRDIRGQGLS